MEIGECTKKYIFDMDILKDRINCKEIFYEYFNSIDIERVYDDVDEDFIESFLDCYYLTGYGDGIEGMYADVLSQLQKIKSMNVKKGDNIKIKTYVENGEDIDEIIVNGVFESFYIYPEYKYRDGYDLCCYISFGYFLEDENKLRFSPLQYGYYHIRELLLIK